MIHVLKGKIPLERVQKIANEIRRHNPDDTVVFIPGDADFFYNYPIERLIKYRDTLTQIIEERMSESKV